jgi:hypothetical protein
MNQIIAIATESDKKFLGSKDDSFYSSQVFKSFERFEKPGEIAMVGWYLCTRWDGSYIELAEKFIVEIEYSRE